MKKLPNSAKPIILRTDFSNPAAWEKACEEIRKPYGKHDVGVEFLEHPEYQGVTKEQLVRLIPEKYEHDLIVVFDGRTAADPKLPLLVFDPVEEPGQSFRAYPPHIFTIETNLLVGNISFYEFERMLDEDGIYCGYPHTAQEFDTVMEPSRIRSILESHPVSPPPKTLDIRQHIRYWLTRLIRKLYMRKL
jgi:hypothetical protein